MDSNFYLPTENDLLSDKYPINTLGDISLRIIQPNEFIREYTEESENSIPFLRAGNIGDGSLNLDDLVFVDKSKIGNAKDSFVKTGDILITRTGANAGETCVVRELPRDYLISSHSIRVIPRKDDVLPEFLESVLLSKLGKTQINRLFTGAAQKQLQLKSVATIKIPLPPLEVQRALVTEMEAARAARQAKLAEAESLLKGMDGFVLEQLGLVMPETDNRFVFSVKFGDIKNRVDAYSNHPRFRKLQKVLLESLSAVELRTLAHEIFSGTTPTAGGDAYTDAKKGVPFVRSGEITADGKVAENIEIYLKPEIHEGMMKRSQLQKGDLLIAIVGATIGATGVYDRSTPANINQAIAGVRLSNKVIPEFVCWYLKSSAGQAVLDFLKRPVARANINLDEIGQILVPVPSLETQKRIIAEVEGRREGARRLRAEAETVWQNAKRRFEQALIG